MAGNPSMTVVIGADNSEFLKKINQTQRALKKGLGEEALGASEGALGSIAALAAGLGVLGIASVKMASDFKANQKAFGVLLGDAQNAEQFLANLAKFAAETPFELTGLMEASKKLIAFKFDVQDIIPIMAAVGDTASLLGSGQDGINGMVTALGQMQAKGKVSAEEMMQFAERGVNAWKYLADSMGVSTAEAMEKVSSGSVSAQKGIEAIVKGMQKDFKGGMESLSQEIPGILSTIKDNASAVAKQMGDQIIAALDLKARLQTVANYLTSFADYVKNNGINQALKNMIPKEVSLAAFVLAGALLGAAVPAMVVFATSAWAALIPLLPFIVKGAALAAVAWVIWQAWQPLGDLFSNAWTTALAWTQQKWAEIKVAVFSGVKYVLEAVQPLLSLFGGGLQNTIAGWMNCLADNIAAAGQEAQNAQVQAEQAATSTAAALSAVGNSLKDGAGAIVESVSGINREFTGLHGKAQDMGAAMQGAGSAGGNALDKLATKAQQVSDAIANDWVQTTKTQLEQLDIWLSEQETALSETKDANENYERDKQRLAETYSEKRRKLLLEEKKTVLDLQRSMADLAQKFSDQKVSFTFQGSKAHNFDIAKDAREQMQDMERNFIDLAIKWETLTKKEKDVMRQAMKENGILFVETEEGKISFAQESANRRFEIERQAAEKVAAYIRAGQALQDDLDAARKEGDLTRYAALLSSESALFSQDLAARQEMIDVYYALWTESHRTAMSYMAEGIKGLYSGMTTFFSDVLSGNKTISQAFQDLGKSVLQMIAQMAAKWIASRIMMATFGKSMQAGELASAAAIGAGVAAAWAPAAAMVSLATLGANAGPAMAGMSATAGVAMGLAGIPALASGGITTGPTLAQIGEGHRQEAVLPLDRKLFERLGLSNNSEEQVQGDSYHITVQAWDGPSVDRWLDANGHRLVKAVKRQARAFNVAAEVGG